MMATLYLCLACQGVEVAVLIEQLGDDRYPVRAQAQVRLEQLVTAEWGGLLLPPLEKARSHSDPEVVRRVVWVQETYYAVGPTTYPATPWLDMLPPEHPHRQAVLDQYLRMARQNGCYSARDWPEYRQATWFYTRDLLRGGWSRTQVIRLLDDMAGREAEWRTRQLGRPIGTAP